MILKKFHIFIKDLQVMFVKNLYYLIDFPSFNVKSEYNGQSIENLGIPKGKKINAIFRTYSEKTYTGVPKKKDESIAPLFIGIF
jgi:hypothetical protein